MKFLNLRLLVKCVRMRKIIFYLFILSIPLLETSCISTGKLTKLVDRAMKDSIPQVNVPATLPGIIISADTILKPEKTVSIRLKSLVIPAILYWQWSKYIDCEIGSRKAVENFARYFNFYADSTGLINKLKDKTLYLTVQSIPKEFVYKYTYINIILIVTNIDLTSETITPQDADLKVEYKLVSVGDELKNGIIKYGTHMAEYDNNEWTPTESFVRRYIYDYNEYLKQMARKICIDLNKKF